ncbi:MAG: glycosyltransferase family 52 [Longicatena sp.]|uniref:Glycosyltransferase family 52 n=1 Tax=Hafnia alvei TaxID=569 RepID=A0A172X021_HAFAL|nr:glycosyltransferase family 52 [Hafnia paralvei]ANF29967.1 glycosyltransferase family 52 [Hafnia alvei]TBM00682.1 hypothetical protein EYY93_10500 [Hafnia paralvei]
MNKNVFVFDTPYCLLVYAILFYDDLEKTTFICSENVIFNESKYGNCIRIKNHSGLIGKFFSFFSFYYSVFFNKKIRSLFCDSYDFYGQDHLFFSRPFLKDFTLIEDGVANYLVTKRKWYTRAILGKNIFGTSPKVKSIYLSGMLDSVPKNIQRKIIYFDLKAAWDILAKEGKENINDLFLYNNKKIHAPHVDIMLLTQPLSEDGVITEDRKIHIYAEIIASLKGKNIVLRKHPRERTDYKRIFPSIIINESKCPIELAVLNFSSIDTVITLYSGGIFSIPCNKKIFKGTEGYVDLESKVGKIKSITIYK